MRNSWAAGKNAIAWKIPSRIDIGPAYLSPWRLLACRGLKVGSGFFWLASEKESPIEKASPVKSGSMKWLWWAHRVLSSLSKSLTRNSSVGRDLQVNPFSAWRQRSHPAPAQRGSNLSLHHRPFKSASILGMCLQVWRCMWLCPTEYCSWPGSMQEPARSAETVYTLPNLL